MRRWPSLWRWVRPELVTAVVADVQTHEQGMVEHQLRLAAVVDGAVTELEITETLQLTEVAETPAGDVGIAQSRSSQGKPPGTLFLVEPERQVVLSRGERAE